jgi:hypothetical protein
MHTPSMGRTWFRRVVEVCGRRTAMWSAPPQSALWTVAMAVLLAVSACTGVGDPKRCVGVPCPTPCGEFPMAPVVEPVDAGPENFPYFMDLAP